MKPRVLLLFLPLLLASCHSDKKENGPRRYPVTTAEAVEVDLPVTYDLFGHVVSPNQVKIHAQVSGILLESFVKPGQYVKKGDPLFLIDPRPFEAALEKAEAQLKKDEALVESAEKRVERHRELVKQDFVSTLNFEQFLSDHKVAEGQVLVDRAEISQAKINLEYCKIYSPIDGKIGRILIYPGNLVSSPPTDQQEIIEILQISPIEIEFDLPQEQFQRLKEKAMEQIPFQIFLPTIDQPVAEAIVSFIDSHVNLDTGTIQLRGSTPNEDRLLVPGEYVRARLLLKTIPQALLVPSEAIQQGQRGAFLYVLRDNNTVELRWVKLGPTVEGKTAILEGGVKKGEKVVVEGQINLHPDAEVLQQNSLSGSDESL